MWKDIPGYEGRYQASEGGYFRTSPCTVLPCMRRFAGRIRSTTLHRSGYVYVALHSSDGCRSLLAHRVVWLTFRGEIPAGRELNHKDGDKTNNALSNLELSSHSANLLHAYRVLKVNRAKGERNCKARLCAADILAIRSSNVSSTLLGAQYGVTRFTICSIRRHRIWKHIKDPV